MQIHIVTAERAIAEGTSPWALLSAARFNTPRPAYKDRQGRRHAAYPGNRIMADRLRTLAREVAVMRPANDNQHQRKAA